MSDNEILDCPRLTAADAEALVWREWLVTNGLGGYASGTIAGPCTRRYHSLLTAALPAPLGRMVMFNHLTEELKFRNSQAVPLGGLELTDEVFDPTTASPAEFRLESGLPVWRYEMGDLRLEKRILLIHLQNTVHITYRLIRAPDAIRLRLRPSFHFRPHESAVNIDVARDYTMTAVDPGFEVCSDYAVPLRMCCVGRRSSFVHDGGRRCCVHYRLERERGYESVGNLWNPGYFRIDLRPGESSTLVASAEDWDLIRGVDPDSAAAAESQRRESLLARARPAARNGLGKTLVLAADQFIIRPTTRSADAALARAAGEEAHTIVAGYHWFTDWGRDTMISLEGLTLITGRYAEAGNLLRTFGRYVRDGLIPNLFPEGGREGLYHTADATLWYFHAIARYLAATGDRRTLLRLLPTLQEIVDFHIRGTHFGIRVDSDDGLLIQGAEGYQLTWMDAKVGDWVVTPRRGKAVEINALWYNALRLLQHWTDETRDSERAAQLCACADRTRESFNRRFWNPDANCLFDVIDGEQGSDPAIRPNQVLAISLDHPVLDRERWVPVIDQVTERLLTPFGLRTLAPGHADYKATYTGDLRARDAAYHQGTVWAWLIGPYIDARLRVDPGAAPQLHELLLSFGPHVSEACVGSISEIFDAEAPYYPRGCVAQAWSVAEVLRGWVKTANPKGESLPLGADQVADPTVSAGSSVALF
jgi:predicted glycogen debranching enzyme